MINFGKYQWFKKSEYVKCKVSITIIYLPNYNNYKYKAIGK